MNSYVFPPEIFNGSLKQAKDDADYIRGRILQLLSIVRGELVADPFFGMPIRVFQSIQDINADAARIEAILSDEVPEANFKINGYISESGIGSLDIFWEYQGTQNNEQFTVI